MIINSCAEVTTIRIKNILEKRYNVIIFTPKNRRSMFIRLFKDLVHRKKYEILIGISSTTNERIFLYYLFSSIKRKIYFPYDITNFYPMTNICTRKGIKQILSGIRRRIIQIIERKHEEILFRISDKIIHKGMKEELKYLKFYNKIKDKPDYLFREFLKTNEMQRYRKNKKLSKNDNEIHLVYVGGLYLKERPETESFWKFYPKITKQKLHLHIYSKQPKKVIEKFRIIETKNPYFQYEGFKYHDNLLKELTKYDYGLMLFGKDELAEQKLIQKVAFGNKIFDYISANIPSIVSKEQVALSNFVEKNDIGISIKYKNIKNLGKYLKRGTTINFTNIIDIKKLENFIME